MPLSTFAPFGFGSHGGNRADDRFYDGAERNIAIHDRIAGTQRCIYVRNNENRYSTDHRSIKYENMPYFQLIDWNKLLIYYYFLSVRNFLYYSKKKKCLPNSYRFTEFLAPADYYIKARNEIENRFSVLNERFRAIPFHSNLIWNKSNSHKDKFIFLGSNQLFHETVCWSLLRIHVSFVVHSLWIEFGSTFFLRHERWDTEPNVSCQPLYSCSSKRIRALRCAGLEWHCMKNKRWKEGDIRP